jgi:uncharacterized LabA/DUF88 family protein
LENELSRHGKRICFIDDSNIFHGQEEAGWRIDWERFQRFLERDGPVEKFYFFSSVFDADDEEHNGFFRFLENELRWEVVLYRLGRRTVVCSRCGNEERVPVEKGVDVGVSSRMLALGIRGAYDTAILVSGDRDYLETVESIESLGRSVAICSWRNSLSHELAEASSQPTIFLDDLREEIGKDNASSRER